MSSQIKYSRAFAMPSGATFSIKPIKEFVSRWTKGRQVIVDPFARNSKIATITNDLNPETEAKYHLDALTFCDLMIKEKVQASLVIFDPPYSARQISECYQGIGRKVTMEDTQSGKLYRLVKNGLDKILMNDGIALSFGWNSGGFGKNRGYQMQEILLVNHGGPHNDTICVAERKV